MAEKYTVADLVAEFLPQVGVSTVFGIVSVHNIPMLDAIGQRNRLRYVKARGEMGGAHMADAYARVTGHLGVIFTSTGPGMANAIPGLVEARFAGSPVLHITGQTATRFIDRDVGTVHDVPGQTQALAAVCKAAYRVRSAGEAFGVLVRAAADALSAPRGPVSVEIPIDLQRTAIPRPAGLDALVLPITAPLPPNPAELDEAAKIDGASPVQTYWLIFIPLATPVLAVVCLLSFIGTFNEFIVARLFLVEMSGRTVAVGLQQFIGGQYATNWGAFAAGSILASIPIVIIFLSLQRYIVNGLTAGSVKG